MDLPSFFCLPINVGLPSLPSISMPHGFKPSFTALHWYTLELLLVLSYTLPLNRSKNHHPIFCFDFLLFPIIYCLLFYRMDELEDFGNTERGMGCRLGALAMYGGANLAMLDPLTDMKKGEDWEILKDMDCAWVSIYVILEMGVASDVQKGQGPLSNNALSIPPCALLKLFCSTMRLATTPLPSLYNVY